MMEYLIIGWDGEDTEAPKRRAAVRERHLALGDKMLAEGTLRYAAAILGEDGAMTGSCMIVRFDSRDKLDEWLEKEPYITGDVWRKYEVRQCKSGPSFENLEPAGK